MSHDCDCLLCQETDSRWAYSRKMTRAKEVDCPRGVHVPGLWSTKPGPGEATYRCDACNVWCTDKGKECEPLPPRCDHYLGDCDCKDSGDYRACKSGTCSDAHDVMYQDRERYRVSAHEKVVQAHTAEANRILRQTAAPVCKDHKRYQGKRKPRVQCEMCWRRYIALNPK